MKRLRIMAVAFGLAVAALAVAGPAHAQGNAGKAPHCLDRVEIQQRIDAGQLKQLSEAINEAGVEGKIISSTAKVCEIDGRLTWQINVMDSYGQSRPVSLPAE